MPLKVIIADDHPLIRMGLTAFFQSQPNYTIAAIASNGKECIEFFNDNYFDLAILDIDMPLVNGLEAAQWIKKNSPQTHIMILTSHTSPHQIYQALQLDLSAILFKENALDEITTALQRIQDQRTYISPICHNFLEHNKGLIERIRIIEKKIAQLSAREIEVLKLIMECKTTQEIADILCNSYKTIENHRANICRKLEIQGNNNLLMFALDNKDIIRMFC